MENLSHIPTPGRNKRISLGLFIFVLMGLALYGYFLQSSVPPRTYLNPYFFDAPEDVLFYAIDDLINPHYEIYKRYEKQQKPIDNIFKREEISQQEIDQEDAAVEIERYNTDSCFKKEILEKYHVFIRGDKKNQELTDMEPLNIVNDEYEDYLKKVLLSIDQPTLITVEPDILIGETCKLEGGCLKILLTIGYQIEKIDLNGNVTPVDEDNYKEPFLKENGQNELTDLYKIFHEMWLYKITSKRDPNAPPSYLYGVPLLKPADFVFPEPVEKAITETTELLTENDYSPGYIDALYQLQQPLRERFATFNL